MCGGAVTAIRRQAGPAARLIEALGLRARTTATVQDLYSLGIRATDAVPVSTPRLMEEAPERRAA